MEDETLACGTGRRRGGAGLRGCMHEGGRPGRRCGCAAGETCSSASTRTRPATVPQRHADRPGGFRFQRRDRDLTAPLFAATAASHLPASMFQGTYTALVTPFRDDAIDEAAFARLIERQIEGGITASCPSARRANLRRWTTRSTSASIRLAVKRAQGRCKVIAGTGSNSPREAIAMTREAEKAGRGRRAARRAVLQQAVAGRALFRHYKAIAEATGCRSCSTASPAVAASRSASRPWRRLARIAANIVCDQGSRRQRGPREPTARGAAGRLQHPVGRRRADAALPGGGRGGGHQRGVEPRSRRRSATWCGPSARARTMRRARCTSDFTRCSRICSSSRTRCRSRRRWRGRGWMLPDVRLPLCEMSAANQAQLRRTLAALGLLKLTRERAVRLRIHAPCAAAGAPHGSGHAACAAVGRAVLLAIARAGAYGSRATTRGGRQCLPGCDVVIDFSSADAPSAVARGAADAHGQAAWSSARPATTRRNARSHRRGSSEIAHRVRGEFQRGREHALLADPAGGEKSSGRISTWKWWRCITG